MKSRVERLQLKIAELELDALLITNAGNRRYISGFTGSTGTVLITTNAAFFLTDGRYTEQATQQCQGFEIITFTNPPGELHFISELLTLKGIKRVGFEKNTITYGQFELYSQKFNDVELVGIEGVVESLRIIKDETEVNIIRQAAQIADEAFSHILTFIRPGITELDVSNELEFFMRKKGAECSSFDIIVASGPRSALPHGRASERVIQPNEFVKMDYGARFKGYVSDLTRTVVIGEPSDKHREIYNIVLEAQLKGVNDIKPGMTGKEADALTRDVITKYGYGPQYSHTTGHGIGIDIHEGPRLAATSDTVLEPGMVVTVEPGIYIPDFGGVRIEDDVLITENGREILTKSTKEFITIPV